MVRSPKARLLLAGAVGFACAVARVPAAPPPGTIGEPGKISGSPLKPLLAEELNQLEKEIASRMMRRADLPAEKRARVELEIDLRIIEHAVVAAANDAKFQTNEQAVAWLRGKELRDAVRAMEDAMAQDTNPASASQKEAMAQLHKLSFATGDAKGGKQSDDFCRAVAMAMVNAVNASPVNSSAIAAMRPRPIAGGNVENKDQPPTVGELTDQVQKLAAISVTLRQQLLALASGAASAADKDEARALYVMLSQSVGLARGLQSNTAVGPEARSMIESQLTEGIVLYSDPRTRDAGKSRIDALGQYRQTLTRIGKMGLSKEQMDQLAPTLAWAQANPETGAKLLGTVEQYMEYCAKWDALPNAVIPPTLRNAITDLRAQFVKARASFLQAASRLGTIGATPADLEQTLDDVKRLYDVVEDVQAMGPSLETINAYKIRPVGGLEKKITTAAIAAALPAAAPNRNDGQKYLDAVHELAKLSQRLTAKPLTDVPPPVVQTWAGGRLDAFETRWKGLIVDLANTLVTGAIELDKAKVARLETALAMGEALRTAAQLEAALPKTPLLARWADWAIDPASLQIILSPYKEAMSGAFFAYANDNLDQVDKWNRLQGRYTPLVALILRDAAYAEQCQAMPLGFVADIGRLATNFDGAPFATERYASYALAVWAILERTGDYETADRVAVDLAKRLAHDLRLKGDIDENPARIGRKPKL